MHRLVFVSVTFTFFLIAISTNAQPTSQVDSIYFDEEDSTDVYVMGTVTVTDRRRDRITPLPHDLVKLAELNKSDGTDIAEIMHEVPAARVQTNSRGESILYLRNAGERQVSIFLDGALLNVPWDNRVDLSLVPLNAVGGIIAEKGSPSVLYGANVMGGAVNILTREIETEGHLTEFKGGIGENGVLSSSLTHLGRTGKLNYIASASFSQRDGISLPADASLPFNQIDQNLRTNTDSRLIGIYARGEYQVTESGALGLSVNVIDSEKGIAPEGHLDPDVDRVRFWRYPDWLLLNGILTYDFRFGDYKLWNLRGAGWATLFGQRIEQYDSPLYTSLTAAQQDDDATFGLRTILTRQFESGNLSFSANQLHTQHDQVDSDFDSAGIETAGDVQSYSQYTFSLGAEQNNRWGQKVQTVLGASFDGMVTLKSADKPKQDPFLSPGLTAGGSYQFSDKLIGRLSVGRKSRFPSMRELYGEALRRFLVNPDLKPESSWNIDLGADMSFTDFTVEASLFTQLTTNTIDQRSFDTLGGNRRQRINLPGSRVYGLESSVAWRITDDLRANGHITISNARAESSNTDTLTFLSEKPEVLSTLNLSWKAPLHFVVDGEAIYTGTAYSLDNDNIFQKLDPSLQLNGRLAWRSIQPFAGVNYFELFIRMDNITDAVTLSQLGLPGAGREVRGGVKVVL
ncbi:MAG: TonB-dependent receptor plug domain-containing protein [Candidatus Kapaibacterium sp.]